jgi:hypothetical protein
MNRLRLALPAIFVLAVAGCGLSQVPVKEDSASFTVNWHEDFDGARRAAASSDRPILAVLVAGELKDKC